VDDVIVHRLGEDDYLLVINAGTREKDIHWVRENTKSFDCVVEELSDAYTQLAIQDHTHRCDEKIDGCKSGRHQELLVHAWNGLRLEEHADRAHWIYRRGWFRDLRALRCAD